MRLTTTSFTNWRWKQLFRDGSLNYIGWTGAAPNFTEKAYKASLGGFDSLGNPQWNGFITQAEAQVNATNQPLMDGGWNTSLSGSEATTGGYFPMYQATKLFNSSATTRLPHLGAMKSGFPSYAWTAMPEVCMDVPDNQGSFPCGIGYGNHNGIGPVRTEGRNIFLMYDGQYKPFGDQIYQYWEDGLLVGQFGNEFPYMTNINKNEAPGQAANIKSFSTVSYNGDVFVIHSDESVHGPIQRWHVSNLASIHEYGGSSTLGATSTVQLDQLF
jgi:hypothetical protein